MRRRRQRAGYRLVHVLPNGSRRVVAELIGAWPEARARAERLVGALQAEVARGNTDAGGVVWVMDTANGTIVQTWTVATSASAGR
jgi:hypothetical protein